MKTKPTTKATPTTARKRLGVRQSPAAFLNSVLRTIANCQSAIGNPLRSLSDLLFKPRLSAAVFANISEATHNGHITKKTDAAITTRFLFGKKGSDDDHIAACTADTDNPYGVINDEAVAAEDLVDVALLGAAQETRKITLGGTVAVGDYLTCDAASKGKKLPTASGTYYIVGRALMAGVSGDIIEFDPIPSVQRVVP